MPIPEIDNMKLCGDLIEWEIADLNERLPGKSEIERAIDTCKQVAKKLPEFCADDLSITAVNALEKQIPKEPIYILKVWADGQKYVDKYCPRCKEELYEIQDCCDKCGQKLDWEDEDDGSWFETGETHRKEDLFKTREEAEKALEAQDV